jgi:hypothetical protein
LLSWAKGRLGIVLQIVRRTDDIKGFQVLPRRWVVERTFAWLVRNRRLARDYERLTANTETMTKVAMLRLMTIRLGRPTDPLGQHRRTRSRPTHRRRATCRCVAAQLPDSLSQSGHPPIQDRQPPRRDMPAYEYHACLVWIIHH